MDVPTDTERIKGSETFRTTELGGPVHTISHVGEITIVIDVVHIPRHTDAPVERFGSGRFSIFLILKSHRQKFNIGLGKTLYLKSIRMRFFLSNIVIQTDIELVFFFKVTGIA